MTDQNRERLLAEVGEAAWAAEVKHKLVPLVQHSACYVGIARDGEPDAKFCLELGVAIMLDKPLVVVVPRGRTCPPGLRRVAHRVVEDLDLGDPQDARRLQAVLQAMMEGEEPAS